MAARPTIRTRQSQEGALTQREIAERSIAYYQPAPVSVAELALMRRIDKLHLNLRLPQPRMLRDLPKREGESSGRRHVSTLMMRMGIEAVYRKPHTSQRHAAHKVYPYLMRQLEITRPNHVCGRWTSPTSRCSVQIITDGKGFWRDDVFAERLWKSSKYEEVYIHIYETVSAAQCGLARYQAFYNQTRPHRALDGQTPDGVYFDNLPTRLTAA